MLKLDIGSGEFPWSAYGGGDGWTTVDAHEDADVKADMGALPFDPCSVDEIFSSHALEHIPSERVQPVLAEWFRVLRPGGKARIRVPNLEWAARNWLKNPSDPVAIAFMFGLHRRPGDDHLNGWSVVTFRAELKRAGFRVDDVKVIWDHNQETIDASVSRLEYKLPADAPDLDAPGDVGADTVLVACPTYRGLEDCLDAYVQAYEAFRWQRRELLLVDNTRDGGVYADQLRARGLSVIHLEPTRSFQETFSRCWEKILERATERGVQWVFSVEQDVICPPLTLDTLLNVATYCGAPFVTHTYPYHWGAKGMYQGLGCTLILRSLLELAMEENRKGALVEGAIYGVAQKQSHVSLSTLLDIKHLDGEKRFWQFDPETDPRVFYPPEYAALDAATAETKRKDLAASTLKVAA